MPRSPAYRFPAFFFLILLCLPAGCAKEGAAPTDAAPAPPTAATSPSSTGGKVPLKIDIEPGMISLRTAMYVPAPSEFQAAISVSAKGISLSPLIVDSPRELAGMSGPVLALETGIRVAGVVMSVHHIERPGLLRRIALAREGLVALKAPQAVLERVDAFVKDTKSGAISDKEITPAIDLVAQAINEGLEDTLDPTTSTLVKAGGWLYGAHLLARAIDAIGLAGEASSLFRQAGLINYFQLFLRSSEPGRAQDPQVVVVLEKMDELKWIAGQNPISTEQVRDIARLTGEIMDELQKR